MKKLLVILLFALATCEAIEESFDDDVVLEKSILSKIKPPKLPSKIKIKPPVKIPDPTKIKIPDPKKIKIPDPKKIKIPDPTKIIDPKKVIKRTVDDIKKLKIKGINGLFGGKIGAAFRKLGEVVKKGIAWLKKAGLWDPIVNKLRELGEKYGNEICEKHLPAEVCGPAIDFALNHILKTDGQK